MGSKVRRRSKRKDTLPDRKAVNSKKRVALEETILFAISENPGAFGIKHLFRYTGIPQREYSEYRRVLHALLDEGKIEKHGKRRLFPKQELEVLKGKLRLTQHGYGFVDRNDGSSVFISAKQASKAYDGDIVEVSLHDTGHKSGPEGTVVSIDTDDRIPCLGQIWRKSGKWMANVKSGPLSFQAVVDSFDTKKAIHPGDWALIQVNGNRRRYPLPACHVKTLVGNPAEKGIAEKGLIASYNLQEPYPEKALREAKNLKAIPAQKGLRHDLSDEFVITIDPAGAKDHDDAVSLKYDEKGNYLLGVHIADVSRYVPEGSHIDREARKRGFSVYLQHHYLPMLPSRLPGTLCSLKPGRTRLALSVLITIDKDGNILKKEIKPSRVRIGKLLSYEEAQKHLDGRRSARKKSTDDEILRTQLRHMWRLASILRKRRFSEGGIDFDLPEMGFRWQNLSAPTAIYELPRLQSHLLIEEFMLAANRAVAEIWTQKLGKGAPIPFRVHPSPEAEKRQKLSDYLSNAGFEWAPEHLVTAKQIAVMLGEVRRRFPPEVTETIARKALTLARYEPDSKGHFGLGFKHYLHFTSPIRRYADLTVHRLIWKHIIGGHSAQNKHESKAMVDNLCKHLSDRERLISEVEREAGKLSGLQYINERRDDVFSAYMVDTSKDNFYISLQDLFIEGTLQVDSDTVFKSRRKRRRKYANAHNTGQTLSIGDKLEVTPSKVDLLMRTLELETV
ncbi:hypothetical protein CEE37_04195 [candidate division LCP-89 bacterium B3_LCP]|uniref:exoribonuclease II n=1 Tax=candidate division LCP-89 bacterium B3_LCP TaxID=2012998 RepID=A0A532V458_UNCL8|nr:MAG: hypothetical protein CEE37_04195 [candidate division LCP-89 bacterium B3_LCP]